ncbi:MAG: sporulation protein YunB [Clostridia bacterium]|nr:sporulation protein YunB [Clostridia bacterium]
MIFVCIIIFLFIFYNEKIIEPNVREICQDKIYSINSKCVNDAILECLNYGVNYEDLIIIEKNQQNEITLMSANSIFMNKIAREILDKVSENIENKLKNGVNIPIFAFSGLELLSGYGKEINFKSISISSVNCNFTSDFKSAGINQTLHNIYLEIKTIINVDFPTDKYDEEFSTKVLLTEAVLVGKIPEIYLNGKLFS